MSDPSHVAMIMKNVEHLHSVAEKDKKSLRSFSLADPKNDGKKRRDTSSRAAKRKTHAVC